VTFCTQRVIRGKWVALAAAWAAASMGCTSLEGPQAVRATAPAPAAKPQPRSAPRFNLLGFPEAYRHGHADACARPAVRNDARIASDADYAMGWNDGRYACEAR
jgi:hypothetical protein